MGSDYAVAESVRRGKPNLTYRNYIGCDHGFFKNEGADRRNMQAEVLDDILDWVGR